MATSYSNPGGQGDRRSSILTSLRGQGSLAGVQAMIDGSAADTFFWGGGTATIVEFWFPAQCVIDEAIWTQSTSSSHGTFKWQGSNDHVNWTDIGSTFTLGGATSQTHTQLNGNSTAYRQYRLFQTAGTTSGTPFLREIEFKIEVVGTATYGHSQGTGNRTGTITQSNSGAGFSAAEDKIINGAFASDLSWSNAAVSGDWVKWDFGSARILQEARWFQSTTNTHGVWQWEGSNDNSNWTAIGSTFTLGDVSVQCVWPSGGATITGVSAMGDLTGNTTAYRYYRILGSSGAASGTPFLFEIEFQLADTQGITTAFISSGAALYPPSLTYVVSGATIASGAVANAPAISFVKEIAASSIASTAAINAPTIAGSGIGLAFIASTVVLRTPTLTAVGSQAVTGAFISSTLLTFAPIVELTWPPEPEDTYSAYRDITSIRVGLIWIEAFLPD